MPDVASVLKEEIQRLARKEVRSSVDPLKKQVVELKRRLREAEGTIRQLETSTRKAVAAVADQTGAIVADAESDEGREIRISSQAFLKHRERLRLTQGEMAALLGVAPATVLRWEHGQNSPRGAGREAFAKLREMGVREAHARLEKMAGG